MKYRIIALVILAGMALPFGLSSAHAQSGLASFPVDPDRNVLSFAGVLEPAFKSVVRIQSGSATQSGRIIPAPPAQEL